MATIEKRGPFQWRVRIRKKGYSFQIQTFETKVQAEIWARKIESEMDYGVFVSREQAERTTFGDLIKRYRTEVTSAKKGASVESIRINAMLRDPLFSRILATITSNDIARYRDIRLQKVSPSTVLRELSVLGHAIDIGIKEWGIYLPSNPVRHVRRPAPAKARDRRLEAGEEERLISIIDNGTRNVWTKPLVQFALETAMRRGELLALHWKYVNLKNRVAHLSDTKNGETRNVPLSTRAVQILQSLPRDSDERVFPITAESFKQSFKRATERAEINNLTFHDLRHEATSRLFEKGLNIMEVAAITGHKDLRMLQRYTHLRAEDLAIKLG